MRTIFGLMALIAATALVFCACGGVEDETVDQSVAAALTAPNGDLASMTPHKGPPPAPCITCPPFQVLYRTQLPSNPIPELPATTLGGPGAAGR